MNHNHPPFAPCPSAVTPRLGGGQRIAALVPLVFFFAQSAWAQSAPDAGSLQQQIDRGRITRLPGPLRLEEQPAAVVQARAPGATLTVGQFSFAGNTLLSADQLQAAVRPYLDRPLDFNQLQEAAFAVAAAYRQAGWIVRSYLPEQDVQQGKVTIQVVESVFSGATVNGPPAARVAQSRVTSVLQAALPKGAPLNARSLERALLLMDDLPGVSVSGHLSEGQAQSETGVPLTLTDEPLLTGNVGLDNLGSRSTGQTRLTFGANLNSPLGMADQLQASAIHTEGSDYLRLGYTLPLGADGWRVGANASLLRYRLVAPEFVTPTDLLGRGKSYATGLEASYPLVRSRQKNLYFSANYDAKRFDNELNGATTTRYQSDVLSLGLNANSFDEFGGGGFNGASLALSSGQLDLGGSPNQGADASTTQTAGNFSKLRYALSRQQTLYGTVVLRAALSGQVAAKNLDSSERFYLGGAGGVRAYASNEGGGSDGNLLNLELLWGLPQGLTLSGFYDHGMVQVNHSNDYTGALALNSYALKGAGLALAWQGPRGTALKATWARRIGDNPNPTATGKDQDGSLVRNRFWLEATLMF